MSEAKESATAEPRTAERLEQVLAASSSEGHIFDIDCWCGPVIEERAGRRFLVHAPAVLHPEWLPGPFVLPLVDLTFSTTINEHAPSACCVKHFDAAREQATAEADLRLLVMTTARDAAVKEADRLREAATEARQRPKCPACGWTHERRGDICPK